MPERVDRFPRMLPSLQILTVEIPARDPSNISDTASDTASTASQRCVDDGLLILDPVERMPTYAQNFAKSFPVRRLESESNLIERIPRRGIRYSRLHASALRHYHLDARLSGKNSIFIKRNLKSFISFTRALGQVDHLEADRLWDIVRNDPRVLTKLDNYPKCESKHTNEKTLDGWCSVLRGHICALLPRTCEETMCQEMYAVSGIIPYHEPTEVPHYGDRRAGYVGKCDLTFVRNGEEFAFIEFKMARRENDKPWEATGAVVPQIICWLGGKRTGRIGVVITELGPMVIYRVPEDAPDENGDPIFKYYSVTNNGRFFDCTGPNASEGRLKLLRIIFEIMMCTATKPITLNGSAITVQVTGTAGNTEITPAAKRARSAMDPTKNMNTQNIAGGDTGRIQSNQSLARPDDVLSTYKYSIRTHHGSLIPVVSKHLLEHIKSDSDSDFDSDSDSDMSDDTQ
jgi:hypothetical protein